MTLKNWMDEHGYTNRALAEKLGLSYEYIYKMAVSESKPISDRFKYLFIQHFGYDEATKVFDVSPNFQAVR
jgi:hypothetical protein